jgi:hypothetical protein
LLVCGGKVLVDEKVSMWAITWASGTRFGTSLWRKIPVFDRTV